MVCDCPDFDVTGAGSGILPRHNGDCRNPLTQPLRALVGPGIQTAKHESSPQTA
jgi:hypothetical protein